MQSIWKGHFLTGVLLAVDVVAFCIIWREAWELRRALDGWFSLPINPLENYISGILIRLLVVWIGVLAYFDHYNHHGKISSLNQINNVLKAGFGLLVGTMATAYLFKPYDIGRSVIFFAITGMTIYVYISRTLLRSVKSWFISRGHGLVRTAIIGSGDTGRAVAARIKNHPEVGYELIGFIDRDPAVQKSEIDGVPVIGDTTSLVDLLLRHRIEEVFLAIPSASHDEQFNLITECEDARTHFKLVTRSMLEVITHKVKIDDIGDMPVIPLRSAHLSPIETLCKRLLDLFLVIPLILLALPIMGIVAFIIRLDSSGSPFFKQERVGQDGKTFKMLKFRTMRSDVDPYAVAPVDSGDERVTRFGRFLRRTSLDELPQFFNVFKGDMSLVGPRPEMPFIVAQYEPWQRRRLYVPPGITGLWQIAGRKRLPLHQNLEYDFYYIRNWSLLLDLEILFKTVPVVLFGSGAF